MVSETIDQNRISYGIVGLTLAEKGGEPGETKVVIGVENSGPVSSGASENGLDWAECAVGGLGILLGQPEEFLVVTFVRRRPGPAHREAQLQTGGTDAIRTGSQRNGQLSLMPVGSCGQELGELGGDSVVLGVAGSEI